MENKCLTESVTELEEKLFQCHKQENIKPYMATGSSTGAGRRVRKAKPMSAILFVYSCTIRRTTTLHKLLKIPMTGRIHSNHNNFVALFYIHG